MIENCLFVGGGAINAVEFDGGVSGLVVGCTISNSLPVAHDGSTSAGVLATGFDTLVLRPVSFSPWWEDEEMTPLRALLIRRKASCHRNLDLHSG